ncbi:hypothetical protein RK21_04437 [Pseudomonas plecoglossicida]|nr:hypothetical protein RK21_04437 [Pseudomonas plecoglossicida]
MFCDPLAGKPAPTGTAQVSRPVKSLWERVYPRRGPHGPRIYLRLAL